MISGLNSYHLFVCCVAEISTTLSLSDFHEVSVAMVDFSASLSFHDLAVHFRFSDSSLFNSSIVLVVPVDQIHPRSIY